VRCAPLSQCPMCACGGGKSFRRPLPLNRLCFNRTHWTCCFAGL
jgi:hypothetical protein